MIGIKKINCGQCAYSQTVNQKSNRIWCRMHQCYFEKSDQCHSFKIQKTSNGETVVLWSLNAAAINVKLLAKHFF